MLTDPEPDPEPKPEPETELIPELDAVAASPAVCQYGESSSHQRVSMERNVANNGQTSHSNGANFIPR